MAIPSLEQIEQNHKERMTRFATLNARAADACTRASKAVAMNKDRSTDELHEVVQELARIIEALVREAA